MNLLWARTICMYFLYSILPMTCLFASVRHSSGVCEGTVTCRLVLWIGIFLMPIRIRIPLSIFLPIQIQFRILSQVLHDGKTEKVLITTMPVLSFFSSVLLVPQYCNSSVLYSRVYRLYHRERILKASTLSCNEEEEEITKPPTR